MNTHRLARLAPDLEQLGLHELAGLGVERGERLVHQQHFGIGRQRAREIDALLHAARKFGRDNGVSKPARPTILMKCSVRSAIVLLIEAPLQFHAVADVAGDGAPWQQARMLKDYGAVDARSLRLFCPSMLTVPSS